VRRPRAGRWKVGPQRRRRMVECRHHRVPDSLYDTAALPCHNVADHVEVIMTWPNAGASPTSRYNLVDSRRSVKMSVTCPTAMRSPGRSASLEKRSRNVWRTMTSAALAALSVQVKRSYVLTDQAKMSRPRPLEWLFFPLDWHAHPA